MRGDGGSGNADSCWAGIDNTLISTLFDFDEAAGTWEWMTQSVSVGSTGTHTVSIWAREDGFFIDKIVLSTSATPPTGNGPAESPQN